MACVNGKTVTVTRVNAGWGSLSPWLGSGGEERAGEMGEGGDWRDGGTKLSGKEEGRAGRFGSLTGMGESRSSSILAGRAWLAAKVGFPTRAGEARRGCIQERTHTSRHRMCLSKQTSPSRPLSPAAKPQ